MSSRLLTRFGLLLLPLLFSVLACNYVLAPFVPPTPTPTLPVLAELQRESGDLRPPTATPTPTPTKTPEPTPTPTNTPEPTPTATINPAALDDPDRPDLSGDVQVYGTDHFLVHYTLSGRDAVSSTDVNGDGVPDYVYEVGLAMEYAWEVEINQLGWVAPPSDGGIGGDTRYDVYLEDIFDDGLAGYTDGGYRDTMVGDNPNSPMTETRASHSYLSTDNNFTEQNLLAPLDLMRVTAAHEFVHAIQFGLDADEPAEWLWEAAATWMEDVVYDHINDQDYYLDAVFDAPDTCQIAEGRESEDDDGHWYGMWIFLRYISERYGNDIIRTLWENLVVEDGYAALETTLNGVGTTLDEIFHGFAVALLTRDFEEGVGYPTVKLKGELDAGHTFSPDDGIYQMAVDYIQLNGTGHVEMILQGLDHALIVALQGKDADVFTLQNGEVSVDVSQYEYVYLVVLNLARASRESDCRETGYSILTGEGDVSFVPDFTLTVPNFNPPRVKLLPGD